MTKLTMASASTSQANPVQSVSSDQSVSSWTNWLLPISLLLALSPLLQQYFSWTWLEGHYQYFPVLIASVIVLVWHHWGKARLAATPSHRYVVVLGLSAVAFFVFLGNLLWTGIFGIVGASLAAVVLIYGWLGWGGLKTLLPVLSLLVLAIPLPMHLDNKLIFNMQFVASGLADLLLDGAGIWHVREGVLLITEHGRYMTEEACSGVRSLFSSLAVVSVFSVISSHRLPRIALNLFQTVFWVFVGNAIRVAACVALADYVSVWFASGSGHELLSLIVFGFILGMVANTDAVFANLIGDRVTWYDENFGPTAFSADTSPSPETHRSAAMFSRMSRLFYLGFVGLFMLLFLFGMSAWRISQPIWNISLENASSLAGLSQGDLPQSLDGWNRGQYEHVQRGTGAMMASNSYTWQYSKDELSAVVSVDCPWSGWHDLNECYQAIGWETTPEYFVASRESVPREELSFTRLQMTKPNSGRAGRVLFTVVDANQTEVQSDLWKNNLQAMSHLGNTMTTRLGEILKGTIDTNAKVALPATTIQVLVEHGESLTPEQDEAIERFFYAARDQLLRGRRWNGRQQDAHDGR
ncbi:exosortase U [Rhodopirellula sallentina]|nr:exosortase U [Rhodopirellula sallentina]